ncbi:MAG: DUF1080 domain-containing protein [Planctomycetales bacterium]|nr:DUF1080 domain-containing protein [Planctomycetales bacterium]
MTVLSVAAAAASTIQHADPQAYDGWRLGVQAWSFNRFTLFEAIDKTRSLGLHWIQAYPGQKISDTLTAGFDQNLSPEQRRQVKDKLTEAGVGIFAFGVTGIPRDPAEARKLFEFAREMGVETIVSEPAADQFDMLDALCAEYKINLGIHNHPKPSHYWNPQTVLEACEGRSKWIGACVDVGHWVRSDLDPVECLKTLQGRIREVHIKEIDGGHDVVWGTGQARIKLILEELHRQGYQGTFSIEYEYNWDNNIPEIRQSAAYFDSVASQLKPTGWKDLFDTTLSNADFQEKGWFWDDGVLTVVKGSKDIWTRSPYGDFVLDLEFKLAKGTNSGVFLRAGNHQWLPWAEVQVEDSFEKTIDRHICGGIFDIQAPAVNAVKPAGQWNRMTIMEKGSRLQVVLNNQPIIDIDLDEWPEAKKNPDGSANKFDVAYKDLPRTGFIGLQDHGTDVWYRNLKIKELR